MTAGHVIQTTRQKCIHHGIIGSIGSQLNLPRFFSFISKTITAVLRCAVLLAALKCSTVESLELVTVALSQRAMVKFTDNEPKNGTYSM